MSSEGQLVSLGSLVEITSSKRIHMADYVTSGIPFYRSKEVIELSKGNRISTELFISREQFNLIKQKFGCPCDDDILLTSVGTLGVPYIVRGDGDFYFKDGNLTWMRNFSTAISSQFLYYWLTSPQIQQKLDEVSIGSTQKALTISALKALQIPLLSRATQNEIVEILGAISDRITLLRETNATLEAIAQALFKSWFVDFDPVRAKMEGRVPEGMDEATAALFPDGFAESALGLVPRGWRVFRLGDATERITKGTTPTTLKRPFVDAGINFVKAESMTGDGGFIPEKFAFIDSETNELLRRSQLQEGDVLISIAGTIGRIAVMTKDYLPANTNQAVALIRPLQSIFPSGLVNRFLRLGDSQQRMREKVVQAVQANLSLGALSDLMLVVPPESVVGRLYNSGLSQIDANWLANDQRIKTLATLRDTLLPRLISAALRLPETA